jgi:hypothetical protein
MILIRPRMLLAVALALNACCIGAAAASPLDRGDDAPKVAGTWTGESICVGNRPACKNEEVVYRFVAAAGRTDLFTLYADKILAGERVPMYKLDFVYDAPQRTLSAEFTRRQTHGLWRYQLSGDVLEGTLVLLPGKEVGRRVKVHRVAEERVPKAPPLTDYEARLERDEPLPARAAQRFAAGPHASGLSGKTRVARL